MKRLLFDVPRWHLFLHREARGLPAAAPDDGDLPMLEDEVFDRLYSGAADRLDESPSPHAQWAERIHAACDSLPAFARLSAECRGDEVAAAAAVEELLSQIDATTTPNGGGEPAKDTRLRRGLVRGCEVASKAVADLREALYGLAGGAVGGTDAASPQVGTGDCGAARRLAARLRRDSRLRDVAKLAGRFKHLLGAKRRQRVDRGADEVTSVEQGGALDRLLPSELARLSSPIHRLALLRDILERQCLQYALSGQEPLGKGPLVVCLDKSSSMSGEPDVFAMATALALLETAQQEKRLFALVCFNGDVCFEATVSPGGSLPEAGLFVACDGGTSIAAAIERSLDLIDASASPLKAADIVLVTDGSSDSSQAEQLRERAARAGVNILGVGIGVSTKALAPWCTEIRLVRPLDTLGADTVEAFAGL